jgi:predicted nucleotidyltransferase
MRKTTKILVEALERRSSVAFAYLFGSRVKGYASKRSDWDVAVYFSEFGEKPGRWKVFELEAELSRDLGATVQVTVLNDPLSPVFGFEIVKGGRVLLDRNENVRMEFENRTLRQYFDWQYFLKRQMKAEKGQTYF